MFHLCDQRRPYTIILPYPGQIYFDMSNSLKSINMWQTKTLNSNMGIPIHQWKIAITAHFWKRRFIGRDHNINTILKRKCSWCFQRVQSCFRDSSAKCQCSIMSGKISYSKMFSPCFGTFN